MEKLNHKFILIVEDDPLTAHDIEASLLSLGYQSPGICSSGEDSLTYIKDHPVDLVLMDIVLSGDIDGIQAADFIIERHEIPVIFLTSNNDIKTIARTKALHPYGYMVKPINARQMYITIEMAFGRYELENRLVKNKNLFSHTLDSINEGVIAVDPEGSIILFNRIAQLLTGVSIDDGLNHPIADVYNTLIPETGDIPENTCIEVLRTEKNIIQRENRQLAPKNGAHVWISESCSPLKDRDNRTIGAVLVFQDITIKKRGEQERIKSQKIESMSLLAAGLAHDFNNLLTGIVGNISMLKLLLSSPEPQISELVSEVEKASLRARDLAGQIRQFAQGGAPVKKPTDLTALISETTRTLLGSSGIDLTIEREDHLKLGRVDPGQTSLVFENLIQNSIQAITEGGVRQGRISISLYNEAVGEDSPLDLDPGNYIRITISDNGPGINPQQLDKIFDPYFTTKSQGTGLGLSSSFNNVKRNGGTITAESNGGTGSLFTLYLPAAETEPASVSFIGEDSLDRGSIIVIDDEESICKILEKMLAALGYTPHVFNNTRKAIEFAGKQHESGRIIRGAILSYPIPGSGEITELTADLQRMYPELYLVLMTGYTTNNPFIENYQNNGFNTLLQKPFAIEDIHKALQTT